MSPSNQDVIKVVGGSGLPGCNHASRPGLLLGKMRIAANKTATRQGADMTVVEGIVFRVVGLSNTEGVGL